MEFAQAIETTEQVLETQNGMPTLGSSLNKNVDLFFAIGSSRGKDVTSVFESAYQENRETAMRCLLWARDVRGGCGERQTFRNLLKHLEKGHPNSLLTILQYVPEYGRWDDLLIFEAGSFVQEQAFDMVKTALAANDGLAAKWMPRKGTTAVALRKHLGMTPKQYRKTLVNLSKTVETQMCAKDWSNINFNHVPSVAAGRYQKAFYKNAETEYTEYRENLVKNDGSAKINAGAVYPYDVIKSMNNGDVDVSIAQWNALPNYMGDDKILPMVDTSGSMCCKVNETGSVSCMDVAVSLGLYIADKQKGPFKDSILTFSAKPELQVLRGTIYDKYNQLRRANWDMNTNVMAAFDLILNVATENSLKQSSMPKYLLILSDMEFDSATASRSGMYGRGGPTPNMDDAAFTQARKKFEAAGYDLPGIVFWNLNARQGNVPVRYNEQGACLVSGFSPAIVESILAAKTLTPESIMIETLYGDRYDVVY